MIVIGDISGIQSYLFDVASEGGGQARRLRARSLHIQLLADAAMLQILEGLGWRLGEHDLISAAGKFVLSGPSPEDAAQKLHEIESRLSLWLLAETAGELRFALASCEGNGDQTQTYRRVAIPRLIQAKSRPWGALAATSTGWRTELLRTTALGTPCDRCRRQTAEVDEIEPDTGEMHQICRRCQTDGEIGRRLPGSRWLLLNRRPLHGESGVFGLGVELSADELPPLNAQTLAIANLADPDVAPTGCAAHRFLRRRLALHVPTDGNGPLLFTDLALQARGDRLLGVLKADADSLGVMIERMFDRGLGLKHLAYFSKRLDDFFAGVLTAEMKNAPWTSIYTVFAGGDDLLLVGPWNVMLDFAWHLRNLFQTRFGRWSLTLSGGLALVRAKRPIKFGAAEAEELLEAAKSRPAPGAHQGRNQFATLGEIWNWKDHDTIVSAGKQLADWVDAGVAERGWLHTLLKFAECRAAPDSVSVDGGAQAARNEDDRLLAHSRLIYHIERNYPKAADQDPRRAAFRRWIDVIANDFEARTNVTTVYFSAILRYALTATRNSKGEAYDDPIL